MIEFLANVNKLLLFNFLFLLLVVDGGSKLTLHKADVSLVNGFNVLFFLFVKVEDDFVMDELHRGP